MRFSKLGVVSGLLGVFCATVISSGCVTPNKSEVRRQPASLAWEQSLAEFTEEYFRISPDRAAQAGRHEYDGMLPDWSPEGMSQAVRTLHRLQEKVAAVSESDLDLQQKFQRQYLLAGIRAELFWREQSGSAHEGIDHYRHSFEIFHLVYGEYAPLEKRMRAVTRFSRSVVAACLQIQKNIQPPMAEEIRGHSARVVRGLVSFFREDVQQVFQTVKDDEFLAATNDAVAALEGLAKFFEDQKGKASGGFALGREKFARMLAEVEGVATSLDEIKRLGLADLARNQAELKTRCEKFAPGKAITECMNEALSDKPADVMAEAQAQLVELKKFVQANAIVHIPSDEEAIVRKTPSYLRWNTASLRSPGYYDRGLPSAYFIAPPDPSWSKEVQRNYLKSKQELLITSAHEVWPGHFLHTLHDNQRPPLLGRIFRTYSTVEGWAHYTEEMMVDLGLGGDDPRIRIAQIKWALMRNARMLSSIGLHTENWSKEQAEKFFQEQAFASQGLAKQQALRGVFDPDYLGYSLGKLMLRKLRDDWLKQRGGRADNRELLREFHDRFLSFGNAPIPLIRSFMLGETPVTPFGRVAVEN